MPTISLATVTDAVTGATPGTFKFTMHGGNCHITFVSLRGTDDEAKCRALTQAADALRAAGLEPTVRLSTKFRGEENWSPMPHIWVNQPTAQEQAVGGLEQKVDALSNQFSQLMSALASAPAPAPATSGPEVVKRPSKSRESVSTPESPI
jgi:hypothetical protein